ncbi:Ethanolaminephosphotransferase 1 [Strongyloides ratti]|uniref:Ethanolaminephosphotransferase 1 n=1 Tax=Strongyloides ratti TaxID=34506 RepID=A0A090MWP5_STRRB|nr:Ethanolaminephosphotransferase 1 [Strongyloides ratti]CEF64044.2 Ethanolaminephosphotransferase 1 [Strongyloides ratti]
MGIFNYKYLNNAKIHGFDNYKYNCIDNSPISVYISHPFWNWFVNFYPVWLAPNVITLVGASLVMGCYFLISYMDPFITRNSFNNQNESPIPSWFWLLAAVCTFLGHLLDGTDGKQARRTGASGPTGELFDHGLDSYATIPFTITIFSIFGQGIYSTTPQRLLGILISVQLVFIVTHWEKYNTGVLFLSWGYDLSQYGLVFLYLFTYFNGYQFYQFEPIKGYTFVQLFEVGFYLSCFVSFLMSFYNMYKAYFVQMSGKQNNFYEFSLPMVSPIILFTSSVLWANFSPSNVITLSPHLFFWAVGTVFSNVAVHLIISQMSCTRTEVFNKLTILYSIISFLSVSGVFGQYELVILKIASLVFTLSHLHYGICLVHQLCDHFKINAFNLNYLNKNDSKHSQFH